jgi:hypothetical protein
MKTSLGNDLRSHQSHEVLRTNVPSVGLDRLEGFFFFFFYIEGKKIYSENHENDLSIPINFDISTSSLILDYENRYFSI